MIEYDVAIIGAGTAGLAARREVAKHTDSYVVIDPGPLGTTCARAGCMPSKSLLAVARNYDSRLQFKEMGIEGAESLRVNSKKVMEHVRELRDYFVEGVKEDMKKWRQKHLIEKKARFVDSQTLDLEGEKIKAKKIIIATGARPTIPDDWQSFKERILRTDTFFELEELPTKMAVVGLGTSGLELGIALQQLGVEVVCINDQKSMAGLTDPELVEYVYNHFSETLNIDCTGVQSMHLEDDNLVIETEKNKFTCEKVFVTLGTTPNLDALDIDKTEVPMNEKGMPIFDSQTCQIKESNIFIAGDVNNQEPVLHEAVDEGEIAGYNACSNEVMSFKRRTRLNIVFSSPEIARVGKTFDELKDSGCDFSVGSVKFEDQGRARLQGERVGLIRLYADNHHGRLVGGELFAPEAEHMAHELAWLISAEMTIRDILSLPFYHPVLEEGLRTAFQDLYEHMEDHTMELDLKLA